MAQKLRLYSIGLFFSFLFCYFEWADRSAFLFEIQWELFQKSSIASLGHPLIILPAVGQLTLLLSLWFPDRRVVLAGLILLGILELVVFLVGALSLNLQITLSTLPFLIVSVLFLYHYRKLK